MNIYIISSVVDTAFPVLLATVGECQTSWLDTFEHSWRLNDLNGLTTKDVESILVTAIDHMLVLENKPLYVRLNDNLLDRIKSFEYILNFLNLCREFPDGYILISR